jgi:hypothetical protein
VNAKELIGKPVQLIWKDPEITGGWSSGRLVKQKMQKIKSYGVVVRVDKEKVVLAGTVAKDGTLCDISKFPVGVIIDIKEVTVK